MVARLQVEAARVLSSAKDLLVLREFKVHIGSEESANENVLLTSEHRQASSHVELDDYFKLCGSWTATV